MCITEGVGCAEIYALNVPGQIFDEVIKVLKQEVVFFYIGHKFTILYPASALEIGNFSTSLRIL